MKKNHISILRIVRKIHRTTGIFLFIFFFIIAITGFLLGWKKNSNGIILPKSYQGTSVDLKNWLPLDTLQTIAFKILKDSIASNIDLSLQRIDSRPKKRKSRRQNPRETSVRNRRRNNCCWRV